MRMSESSSEALLLAHPHLAEAKELPPGLLHKGHSSFSCLPQLAASIWTNLILLMLSPSTNMFSSL